MNCSKIKCIGYDDSVKHHCLLWKKVLPVSCGFIPVEPSEHNNSKKNILIISIKEYLLNLETDEERINFIDECLDSCCKLCGSKLMPCFCAPCYDE